MSASNEKVQAHVQILRWSHTVQVQVERLHSDRRAFVEHFEQIKNAGHYAVDDARPGWLMQCDAHLLPVAARQLQRALSRFDGNERLPAGFDKTAVRMLRNAGEHWAEPTGRAVTWMAARGADLESNQWSVQGPGLLGDLVPDTALGDWAKNVYDELRHWDEVEVQLDGSASC